MTEGWTPAIGIQASRNAAAVDFNCAISVLLAAALSYLLAQRTMSPVRKLAAAAETADFVLGAMVVVGIDVVASMAASAPHFQKLFRRRDQHLCARAGDAVRRVEHC